MILNYMYCSLHPDTEDYLRRLLGAHPEVYIDWDPKIEIMVSPDSMEANPNAVYSATAESFNLWYNSAMGGSQGIIPLQSDTLETRHAMLLADGIRPAFPNNYNPHMVLIPHVPPLKRVLRAWINSVANALISTEQPLLFTGETVVAMDFSYPLEFEYNQEMDRARGL